MKFVSSVDFGNQTITNMVVPLVSGSLSSGPAGLLYYNTVANTFEGWTGLVAVSLGQTVATAATPNTVVKRDASGNFSANIITATLSGNAATASLASNSTNLNNQAGSYYTNRANHSGTQLSATISDLSSAITSTSISSFAIPTANINAGSYKIINLANPSANTDAANAYYVNLQITTSLSSSLASYPTLTYLAANYYPYFTPQNTIQLYDEFMVSGGGPLLGELPWLASGSNPATHNGGGSNLYGTLKTIVNTTNEFWQAHVAYGDNTQGMLQYGTGSLFLETKVAVSGTPGASDTFTFYSGMSTGAGSLANIAAGTGVYFKYTRAGNIQAIVNVGGTETQIGNTFVPDTNYHKFRITSSDWKTFTFLLDGVQSGTTATIAAPLTGYGALIMAKGTGATQTVTMTWFTNFINLVISGLSR